MKLLELFAGTRSVGKIAETYGIEVFSVDWGKNFKNIDLYIDIEQLQISDIPFIPDIIWASPDCTTYSVSAFWKHRKGTEPKTDYAKKCDNVNLNLMNLIDTYLKLNPNLIYFIENPMGMLRKMDWMLFQQKTTIWYCRYGDFRAKPTDIFTNTIKWKPKQPCSNNNKFCKHERSPRGIRTGTTKLKKEDRSLIPPELVHEIIQSCIKKAP